MKRTIAIGIGVLLITGVIYGLKGTFKQITSEVSPQEPVELYKFPPGLPSPEEIISRIDIFSFDKKCRLRDVKSGGTTGTTIDNTSPPEAKDTSWMIRGIAGLTNIKPYEWKELWVEFIPIESGTVMFELKGEYDEHVGVKHRVWVDDVAVEGASVKNGSFEIVDENGNPKDWGFDKLGYYSKDGTIAKDGKACVLVWHGRGISQSFAVKAGEKYRISAWFRGKE